MEQIDRILQYNFGIDVAALANAWDLLATGASDCEEIISGFYLRNLKDIKKEYWFHEVKSYTAEDLEDEDRKSEYDFVTEYENEPDGLIFLHGDSVPEEVSTLEALKEILTEY